MIRKKRITATMNSDVIQKIREVQAWYMLKTNKAWSFSKALEFLASEGIDSFRKNQDN
jgi:hypothetical protein